MIEQHMMETHSTDDFFALLAQQSTTLLHMAAAMVGPDDAEDAVQEAVTRAWRAWPSLRDPASANAWLLRIVGNVCRDWRRGPFGARQRLSLPLDSEIDERGAGAAYGVSGESALSVLRGGDPGSSDHAAALDLQRALSTLDEDVRLVILLRYFVGLDATEIGHALNVPPATIRTRLRRGLALLRQSLAPAPLAGSTGVTFNADTPTAPTLPANSGEQPNGQR